MSGPLKPELQMVVTIICVLLIKPKFSGRALSPQRVCNFVITEILAVNPPWFLGIQYYNEQGNMYVADLHFGLTLYSTASSGFYHHAASSLCLMKSWAELQTSHPHIMLNLTRSSQCL